MAIELFAFVVSLLINPLYIDMEKANSNNDSMYSLVSLVGCYVAACFFLSTHSDSNMIVAVKVECLLRLVLRL